jgi:hypothetical protein
VTDDGVERVRADPTLFRHKQAGAATQRGKAATLA